MYRANMYENANDCPKCGRKMGQVCRGRFFYQGDTHQERIDLYGKG